MQPWRSSTTQNCHLRQIQNQIAVVAEVGCCCYFWEGSQKFLFKADIKLQIDTTDGIFSDSRLHHLDFCWLQDAEQQGQFYYGMSR